MSCFGDVPSPLFFPELISRGTNPKYSSRYAPLQIATLRRAPPETSARCSVPPQESAASSGPAPRYWLAGSVPCPAARCARWAESASAGQRGDALEVQLIKQQARDKALDASRAAAPLSEVITAEGGGRREEGGSAARIWSMRCGEAAPLLPRAEATEGGTEVDAQDVRKGRPNDHTDLVTVLLCLRFQYLIVEFFIRL